MKRCIETFQSTRVFLNILTSQIFPKIIIFIIIFLTHFYNIYVYNSFIFFLFNICQIYIYIYMGAIYNCYYVCLKYFVLQIKIFALD